jgi:hypothetical protein
MFKVLRPVDLAVLGMITMGVGSGLTASLGLSDPASVIALTMGLTCPAARRLIAWRRGVEAVRMQTVSAPVVACAMLPWMLLPVVHNMPWEQVSHLTTLGIAVPSPVKWAGVVLTMFGVLRPMMETLRGTGRIRSSAYLETVGLFVSTGSGFLAMLAVSWVLARTGLEAQHVTIDGSLVNAS